MFPGWSCEQRVKFAIRQRVASEQEARNTEVTVSSTGPNKRPQLRAPDTKPDDIIILCTRSIIDLLTICSCWRTQATLGSDCLLQVFRDVDRGPWQKTKQYNWFIDHLKLFTNTSNFWFRLHPAYGFSSRRTLVRKYPTYGFSSRRNHSRWTLTNTFLIIFTTRHR